MSQRTPVIMMVLEGDEAVNRIRDAAGSTAPGEANRSTIRRHFGHASKEMLFDAKGPGAELLTNTIHTSATHVEADVEINNFFRQEELVDYQPMYSRFAYTKPSKKTSAKGSKKGVAKKVAKKKGKG